MIYFILNVSFEKKFRMGEKISNKTILDNKVITLIKHFIYKYLSLYYEINRNS